jgi:hypothetical protein
MAFGPIAVAFLVAVARELRVSQNEVQQSTFKLLLNYHDGPFF